MKEEYKPKKEQCWYGKSQRWKKKMTEPRWHETRTKREIEEKLRVGRECVNMMKRKALHRQDEEKHKRREEKTQKVTEALTNSEVSEMCPSLVTIMVLFVSSVVSVVCSNSHSMVIAVFFTADVGRRELKHEQRQRRSMSWLQRGKSLSGQDDGWKINCVQTGVGTAVVEEC